MWILHLAAIDFDSFLYLIYEQTDETLKNINAGWTPGKLKCLTLATLTQTGVSIRNKIGNEYQQEEATHYDKCRNAREALYWQSIITRYSTLENQAHTNEGIHLSWFICSYSFMHD